MDELQIEREKERETKAEEKETTGSLLRLLLCAVKEEGQRERERNNS